MRHVAQRQRQPVRERDRLRQPLEPRRDPAAIALREAFASRTLPRIGMVRTTVRVAAWMRSV